MSGSGPFSGPPLPLAKSQRRLCRVRYVLGVRWWLETMPRLSYFPSSASSLFRRPQRGDARWDISLSPRRAHHRLARGPCAEHAPAVAAMALPPILLHDAPHLHSPFATRECHRNPAWLSCSWSTQAGTGKPTVKIARCFLCSELEPKPRTPLLPLSSPSSSPRCHRIKTGVVSTTRGREKRG